VGRKDKWRAIRHMPGKLKQLMSIGSLSRTETHYESVMDDFVEFANGHRLADVVPIPSGRANADYYFEFEDFDCLLELKQACSYDEKRTVSMICDERGVGN
jgi:hypothetical protein